MLSQDSVCSQLDRPAGAGRVMVPVMVLRAEHVKEEAYRPAAERVNCRGTDTFESGDRVSFAP